ncbi:MAG: helix-turn-helix transcriptional regulator [Cytophagales bacterium]|nr:helix-turn-helix transcriptional regulator [Cytophagales bacterium]
MTSFGKRVRDLREAKFLNQHHLGEMVNTSYAVIGKYERDEIKPSIVVAKNIAKALGTTLGYLVGEEDLPTVLKEPEVVTSNNSTPSFGQRMKSQRQQINMSQSQLAKIVGTSHVSIAKYEIDEQRPSIDTALKIAKALDTTLGYLTCEFDYSGLNKDQKMLKIFNDILSFSLEDQSKVFFTIDAMIHHVKIRNTL